MPVDPNTGTRAVDLPFLTASIAGAGELVAIADGYESGTSAWSGAGALAMLLILAATALIAVKVFAPHALPAGVPLNLIAAVHAGLGTVILVLRVLTNTQSEEMLGVTVQSVGPGWSGIVLLLLPIALPTCTALGFKNSDEALPWHTAAGGPAPGSPSPTASRGPARSSPGPAEAQNGPRPRSHAAGAAHERQHPVLDVQGR